MGGPEKSGGDVFLAGSKKPLMKSRSKRRAAGTGSRLEFSGCRVKRKGKVPARRPPRSDPSAPENHFFALPRIPRFIGIFGGGPGPGGLVARPLAERWIPRAGRKGPGATVKCRSVPSGKGPRSMSPQRGPRQDKPPENSLLTASLVEK